MLAFIPERAHIRLPDKWSGDPRKSLVLTKTYHSSGDVIADRRAGYAKMLAEGGDHAAAADLMGQALELTPDWAAGWDLMGDYADKAGDISGAISAWRHLEALDDEGVFGAGLKLASHGAGVAANGTAVSYVEALFDQYAPQFEHALVDKLGYRVPEMLNEMVSQEMARLGISGFARALDLGCGTGLMGERLRGKTEHLEGIDVSAAMIAETARKGIYDTLQKAELVAALTARRADADLVTAADVFIYCGAIQPVLAALVPALQPGGLAAFSLEAHDGPEALFLRPSLRYAHGVEPTRDALVLAGLEILRFETAVLRLDRGAPITGMLIVVRKPPLALSAANQSKSTGGDVAA
ncbi:MAG: methyltransferase [Devosia sp.]|nr:methyltransferase [Devosia sp.]